MMQLDRDISTGASREVSTWNILTIICLLTLWFSFISWTDATKILCCQHPKDDPNNSKFNAYYPNLQRFQLAVYIVFSFNKVDGCTKREGKCMYWL